MARLIEVQDLREGMFFDALSAVKDSYEFGDNEHDDAVIVAAENLMFEAVDVVVSGDEVFVWSYPFNICTRKGVKVEIYD